MKTSQNGIDIIKQFEGCRLTAYLCPAGVPTIGYGHTAGVKLGQAITKAQAEEYLKEDLEKYEQKVMKYHDKYRWGQNEFDALVSFAYNLGSIDQLTAGGTRSRATIAEKMLLYNKAAGKINAGLTQRRQAERELFLTPVSCTGATMQAAEIKIESGVYNMKTIKKGSRGTSVKVWQLIVGAAPDGIFGGGTENLTRKWQENHGLSADGIVGAKSWKAGLETL